MVDRQRRFAMAVRRTRPAGSALDRHGIRALQRGWSAPDSFLRTTRGESFGEEAVESHSFNTVKCGARLPVDTLPSDLTGSSARAVTSAGAEEPHSPTSAATAERS
eukprot:scaffold11173_cov101-Isochrysis_galbana.AAC.1